MVHIPLVPACTCIPAEPAEPLPQPAGTLTLVGGYGFVWVRVQVALEYPRVTRYNLYFQYPVEINGLHLLRWWDVLKELNSMSAQCFSEKTTILILNT